MINQAFPCGLHSAAPSTLLLSPSFHGSAVGLFKLGKSCSASEAGSPTGVLRPGPGFLSHTEKRLESSCLPLRLNRWIKSHHEATEKATAALFLANAALTGNPEELLSAAAGAASGPPGAAPSTAARCLLQACPEPPLPQEPSPCTPSLSGPDPHHRLTAPRDPVPQPQGLCGAGASPRTPNMQPSGFSRVWGGGGGAVRGQTLFIKTPGHHVPFHSHSWLLSEVFQRLGRAMTGNSDTLLKMRWGSPGRPGFRLHTSSAGDSGSILGTELDPMPSPQSKNFKNNKHFLNEKYKYYVFYLPMW